MVHDRGPGHSPNLAGLKFSVKVVRHRVELWKRADCSERCEGCDRWWGQFDFPRADKEEKILISRPSDMGILDALIARHERRTGDRFGTADSSFLASLGRRNDKDLGGVLHRGW